MDRPTVELDDAEIDEVESTAVELDERLEVLSPTVELDDGLEVLIPTVELEELEDERVYVVDFPTVDVVDFPTLELDEDLICSVEVEDELETEVEDCDEMDVSDVDELESEVFSAAVELEDGEDVERPTVLLLDELLLLCRLYGLSTIVTGSAWFSRQTSFVTVITNCASVTCSPGPVGDDSDVRLELDELPGSSGPGIVIMSAAR